MASQYSINAVFAITNNAVKQFAEIEKQVEKATSAIEYAVNKGNQHWQKLGVGVRAAINSGAVMAVDALTSGIRASVNEWVSFDKATTESIALFGEFQKGTAEYEASFKALGNAAREVGAVTEFTASDAAGALSKMAMAGMSSEKSMELLMGTTNLATASGLDLSRAVDIVTDSLGAFGMDATAENLQHLSDVMALTTTTFNTDMESMFEAITYAAPAFTTAGQDIETFAMYLGLLANAGIKGSSAGTALNAIFTKLSMPGSNKSMGTADWLEMMGVGVQDELANFENLADIMNGLQEVVSGMGNFDKAQNLTKYFGERGGKAVKLFMGFTEGQIDEYQKKLYAASGAAEQMANVMRGSIANQVKLLQSGLIDKGLSIVDSFREKTSESLTKLIEVVQKINPDMLIASLDLLLTGLINVVSVAWNLRGVLLAVGVAVGLFKGAMMAIAAYQAATKVATVVQAAYAIAIKGSTAATAALTFMTGKQQIAANVLAKVMKVGPLLQMKALTVATKAQIVATKIATGVQAAFNAAMSVNPAVWVVVAVLALVAVLVLLYKKCDKFRELVNNIGTAIKDALLGVWDKFKSVAGGAIDAVKNAWSSLVDFIKNGGLWSAIRNIGASIVNFLLTPLRTVLQVGTYIPGVGGWAQKGLSAIDGFVESIRGDSPDAGVTNVAPVNANERAINSYSREESVSRSELNINLPAGASGELTGNAPGIRLNRSDSGIF